MKTVFNFESHVAKNGYPVHEIGELPLVLHESQDSIIRQAGFDPAECPLIGVILAPASPTLGERRRIIVAPDMNFVQGSRYAVSTDPVG